MKKRLSFLKSIPVRLGILMALLLFVWCAMYFRGVGEWYARALYPGISKVLSRFSSLFPFSVGDCFIYGSILGLLVYLVYSIVRRKRFLKTVFRIIEYLAWVYVWFYMAWGLNYFRQNFFSRTKTIPVKYSPGEFHSFLINYTDSLNATYYPVDRVDTATITAEVKKGYRAIHDRFHIVSPGDYLRGKPMLISPFMSAVGVKGYMGPFFAEFTLNRQLQPVEYPSTYAHEMAHVLGISNEAEANLCAYLVCTSSENRDIRFAGYFSIFSYVLGNAYRLLPEEEFVEWRDSLQPEIRQLYNEKVVYWQNLYSPWIGEVQDKAYNMFLKGNNISSGTANYSQVIAYLIAYLQSEEQDM